MAERSLARQRRGEVMALGKSMSLAYRQMVKFYQTQMQLTAAEADAKTRELAEGEYRERILNAPADQVSWFDFNALAEEDSDAAHALWERVKEESLDELVSGQRAA